MNFYMKKYNMPFYPVLVQNKFLAFASLLNTAQMLELNRYEKDRLVSMKKTSFGLVKQGYRSNFLYLLGTRFMLLLWKSPRIIE